MRNYVEIFRHKDDKLVPYKNAIACRSEIPMRNGCILWSKMSGYIFDFSYQGFVGKIEIVNYDIDSCILSIKINDSNVIYTIGRQPFMKVGFREIIKIRYHEFNIGDIVANKEILGISYNRKRRSIMYRYKCLNDGYIADIYENNLKRNIGMCPVCVNHDVLIGYNDIPSTNPWMIDYFQGGYDEAKLYVATTNRMIVPKCPHCGEISNKKISVNDIYRNKGFSCKCSDKITYPEKFMINLLDLLGVDYLYQCGQQTLKWIDNKYIYDFYIESKSIIIETHGEQHYKEATKHSKWGSLDLYQTRDLEKQSMAIENGIKNYIILDCRESNIEWIKKSVMKSDLPNLFCFNEEDIDWNKIDQLSMRNIVREICLYKNDNPHLLEEEIAQNFHVHKRTLSKYYRIGEKYGWCRYNKLEERWLAHFHRNTHYSINGHLFYNGDDIEKRSEEVFGEKIRGGAVRNYLSVSSGKRLFRGKYEIKTLTHREYLEQNIIYPEFVSKKTIDGLLKKYSN